MRCQCHAFTLLDPSSPKVRLQNESPHSVEQNYVTETNRTRFQCVGRVTPGFEDRDHPFVSDRMGPLEHRPQTIDPSVILGQFGNGQVTQFLCQIRRAIVDSSRRRAKILMAARRTPWSNAPLFLLCRGDGFYETIITTSVFIGHKACCSPKTLLLDRLKTLTRFSIVP